MDFFQFSVPTKLVFCEGLASDFSAELESLSAQKYFIITDQVISDLGLIDPIAEGIKAAGREVTGIFTDVPSDSGVKVIEKAAQLAKESGADGLVAIGGGSVLDTAKGANILFTLGGNLIDDYSGAQTITENLSPLIAIPTTAGTGSEVTEAIVILDEESGTKLSFVDSHLLPSLAILDPSLTYGLPPKITAATAMDALTHSVESLMCVQKGPVSDALALQAIKLIHQNLIPALQNGEDSKARGALLVASTLAGIAFNHAMVGVVHAMAHTVGALFHIHHGTANSILLPYGMEYNFEESYQDIAKMADAFSINTKDKNDEEIARSCIQAIKNFKIKVKEICGLSVSLSDEGIDETKLSEIAEKSPEDGASFYNPRELDTEALLPILKRAYVGE